MVAMRQAIGSMPRASRSGLVSVIFPRAVRPCCRRSEGSWLPSASTKVSSTQVSAGMGVPCAGRSLPACGIGVIVDIGWIETSPLSRVTSHGNSIGPSSGARCERIKCPVRHQTIALAIDVLPEPLAPSNNVTFLVGPKLKVSGGSVVWP